MKNHAAYGRRANRQKTLSQVERRRYQLRAEKQFIKLLDKALDACYEANIENRGDVLTLNIKDLYFSLTNPGKLRTPSVKA